MHGVKEKERTERNAPALIKYLCALLLFGLNGIVASHIALNSYEIVFLRTLIGSILLLCVFIAGKGRFHWKEHRRDYVFIALSGIAMGTSWMFLYEAYQQIGVSYASLLYYCGPVIVMILSPLIFKEKLTVPKVAGFMIVLIGIILVNGKRIDSKGNTWGLACGALSAVMYFSPLSKLQVQTVAVCGYLEPLSAVIFAALLLGEKMSVIQYVGAVCIIGGAMIGELIRKKTQ